MDNENVRERLLEKRWRVERSIRRMTDQSRESLKDTLSELSVYDNHNGDLGSETFEREKDLGILEMLESESNQITQALERIEEGNYGICTVCGQTIDPRRLDRLPYTDKCVECAKLEDDRWGPPREGLPPDMSEIIEKGEVLLPGGMDLYDEDLD